MKKILATAAVFILSTTLAFAGHGHKGDGHRGKHGEWNGRMGEKLNLSEAQKQQIQTIQRSFREQNEPFFNAFRETKRQYKEARQAGDTTRAESLKAQLDSQKTQMRQLQENQRRQIVSILTPEQRTQLEAMKAERGHGNHGNRND